MRILFLRHHMLNIGGTGIYTRLLIKALALRDHQIGLWPTDRMVYKDLYDLPIICMKSREKNINREWDVIVIQRTQTLNHANHLIQQLSDLPHIFISHSSLSDDQIVPYRQLYKVIRIADSIDRGWGIPENMHTVIYNPVDVPKFRPYHWREKPPYNILLVSRLDSDRINMVRDIIYAVNQMPDYRLIIVGGGMDYLLKSICNQNIIFAGQQLDTEEFYQQADLVIGSGRSAVEGMAYCRPVVICGLRGLGGLITPENYERFRNMMFSGRYKGKLHERIPVQGLIASILAAQKCSNLNDYIHENYNSVNRDFGLNRVANKFESVVHEVVNLHSQIHNDNHLLKLRPVFNSECEICKHTDGKSYQIFRLDSGQYLGHTDQRGRALLAKFNGEYSLCECARFLGCENGNGISDILNITRQLWYQKLITFQ